MNCKQKLVRCGWARNEVLMVYHDREWGVPQHDERKLFEFLLLEGAQAGLSWETILRKRENYRSAFDDFDIDKIAHYTSKKIQTLLRNEGIVRNRLKVLSAVTNAKACLSVREEFGSFDPYIWQFVGGTTRINHWRSMKQVPTRSIESDAMSTSLQKRGFSFVGSTICYAFMQAVGMVNDHLVHCFRHTNLAP